MTENRNFDRLAEETRRAVGLQISEARKAAGLSMRTLGTIVGIRHGKLSELEQGRANVTIDTLTRVCGSLGLKITLTQ